MIFSLTANILENKSYIVLEVLLKSFVQVRQDCLPLVGKCINEVFCLYFVEWGTQYNQRLDNWSMNAVCNTDTLKLDNKEPYFFMMEAPIPIGLQSNSVDRFLYHKDRHHKRVKRRNFYEKYIRESWDINFHVWIFQKFWQKNKLSTLNERNLFLRKKKMKKNKTITMCIEIFQ